MPVTGVARFERFFRAAAGLDVDKDDLRRYSDVVNHKLHDLLIIGQATARANGRDIIQPSDLPITKGLQERIHEFERLDEEVELQPILDGLAALPQLDLVVSVDTEARFPGSPADPAQRPNSQPPSEPSAALPWRWAPRIRNSHHHREHIMDWTLEVVILPVSDIDRAVAFYRDQVGFDLDHDTKNEHMHVVQLTPRGSGCSIVFGDLPSQREMEPGSMKGLQLVVPDAAAARQELIGRGVEASEPVSFGDQDGSTFFGFADPDGNTWAVQELKVRAQKPLIPVEARGRFGA